MDDISAVIISLQRKRSLTAILERLVAESIHLVKFTLETHAKDGAEEYKKYLNLWDMIEAFEREDSIPRSRLINEIFKDEWQDLEEYEEKGLIQFSVRLEGKIQDICENPTGRDLVMLKRDTIDILPSKQRVKLAFKFVLANVQLVERTQRIRRKYKKKKLQKELDEELAIYDRLQMRRTFALEEQINFLKYYETLKSLIGDKLIHQHAELVKRLDQNEIVIEEAHAKITKLSTDIKHLEE